MARPTRNPAAAGDECARLEHLAIRMREIGVRLLEAQRQASVVALRAAVIIAADDLRALATALEEG